MKFVELEETTSTNSYLASIARESPHGLTVICHKQTAGRGQRGNTWEASPGCNITMSLLLRPDGLHPSQQFIVSQAVSVAITNVLRRYLPDEKVSVKWPNDIYVGDRKICGILIENSITSSGINHCIVGMGINVNQKKFLSDAPNPVSMTMLTGKEFSVMSLAEEFVTEILRLSEVAETAPDSLRERYSQLLWRREGYWPYIDNLRNERIKARIAGIAPDGILTLALAETPDEKTEETRSFAFKEVTALLD